PADFAGPVYESPDHMKVKADTDAPDMPRQTAPMQLASGKPSPMIPKPMANGTKEDAEAFVKGLPGTASPEERNAAAVGPVLKASSKAPIIPNGEMRSKLPAPEAPPPVPDANQVIAD